MSSSADLDLVRRDTVLPGLSTLLDTHALSKLISDRAGRSFDQLDLVNLRYKPRTNCVAAYLARDNTGTTLLYAKAHGTDAEVKLAKAQLRPGSTGDDAFSPIIAEQLGVAVFGFPDDMKLPILTRLAEPASRLDLLGCIMSDDEVIPGDELETLAYKPERRYVARFAPERPDGGAVLKFYSRQRHRVARRATRGLESRGRLCLPQRCGGSKRHNVLALKWIPGPTLRGVLDAGQAVDLGPVGAAIAELHSQRDVRLARRSRSGRLLDLHVMCETLGFIYPPLEYDASRLAERVTSAISNCSGELTSIHGDLYDKQVVLSGDRVGLVDLDDAMRGDVRQDLGLFIAHLERDRLLGRPLERVETLCGELLEGYQEATGKRVQELSPFVAEGLLRLAHHPFRGHGPGWPEQTKAILERTRELLAGSSPYP